MDVKMEERNETISITDAEERAERSESISVTDAEERAEHSESISITDAEERAERSESISVTDAEERAERSESISITDAEERAERSESISITDAEERVITAEVLKKKFKDIIDYADVADEDYEFSKLIDNFDIPMCCAALESHEPKISMSVFEHACSNFQCEQYIKECISVGCDTYKRSPKCGRRPFSFAIEKFEDANLGALLSDTCVEVDFKHSKKFKFTPFNYVLEKILNEHAVDDGNTYAFMQKYRCFELLVKHCADVNVPGKDGKTPIRQILEEDNFNEERKRTLVKCIFDHAKYVDIDDDNGAMRAKLNELIPELEIPAAGVERQYNEFELNRCLDEGNEIEFWSNYVDYDRHKDYYIVRAARNGLTYSAERLLRSPPSLNNYQMSKLLFSILWQNDVKFERETCVDLVLNHGKMDVNYKLNMSKLLLDSLSSERSNVTAKLLDAGAYFGVDDESDEKTLSKIKPQLLDKHFDSCLFTNGRLLHDKRLQLTFDYKNLIPIHKGATPSDGKLEFCEMKAVENIMESDTLGPLLRHPLIEGFVELKWNLLAPIFYVNFFVYFLFAMLNIVHIFFFFLDDVESTVSRVMSGTLMVFLCVMTVREAIQMISSPLVHFKRWQNYPECALIGLIGFILFGNCPLDWRGTVAAIAILLITYELCILLGSLPIRFFATHFVMLETVATNFFKSLLFYSIIIVAFALAFRSLFHKLSSDTNVKTLFLNATDDEEDKYNNFQTIGLSLLKSLVMANGELDTSSIHLNDNPFSYVAFVAFVLIVTTVLGNLLSGLAVSDINDIRSQAELIHLSRRCKVLTEYERVFLSRRGLLNRFPKLERFLRSKIWLFPDYRIRYQMSFKPNEQDAHHPIDEDILKEALKRLSERAQSDENEIEVLGNEIKVLGNEISKIADGTDSLRHEIKMLGNQVTRIAESNKESARSLQYEIDSIGKTVKSIEKLLEQR